jgi:hypothetical protein
VTVVAVIFCCGFLWWVCGGCDFWLWVCGGGFSAVICGFRAEIHFWSLCLGGVFNLVLVF